jgi:ribosomal protein L37AE/L43A
MSEGTALRQLCPACGSVCMDFTATVVGQRQVWRCHHCDRSFRPPKKKESVLLRIRTFLKLERGQDHGPESADRREPQAGYRVG